MKKPNVVCPACKEVHLKLATDEYVVICAVILAQYEKGESNYENYTIVPIHCQDDSYSRCHVWREEKEANWARKHDYSSIEQQEQIRL